MKKSEQSLDRMSKARSRSVTAVLTFAVTLVAVALATPSAQAQTFTLLYSFQGAPSDGQSPLGELILDQSGNLYGTTWSGGNDGIGTVFELNTSGKETVLHSFSATTGDGNHPEGNIVRYAGNIYGTTYFGGGTGCDSNGCGTVFELAQGKENILHSFTEIEGTFSGSGLVRDASGNLYGTTAEGSGGTLPPACGTQGCGTVFEISQGQETVLYSFGGMPDAANPSGSLILDRAGNLYGITSAGGTFGAGTVFELSPNSNGTWTEQVLYNFRGKSDGADPATGVVIDGKGNLYGTTFSGGLSSRICPSGCGVVFKLARNLDGSWTERVLHKFAGPPNDGQLPFGALVRDKQGNIYGVTFWGGTFGDGTVFKLDSAGQETLLHAFTGGPTDGAGPETGVILDGSGNLYGTTIDGGAGACNSGSGCGTVFKITP